MITALLFAVIGIVSSQIQEQPLCSRLGSVYESMCPGQVQSSALVPPRGPQGKKGAVGARGEKGDKGSIGQKGSNEQVDYDRIEAEISRRVQEATEGQAQKIFEISNALMKTEQRIREIRNIYDSCPIRYRGKCFWIEMDENGMNYQKAESICTSQGSRPASIYSSYHYKMLKEYLRMFAWWGSGFGRTWLGMKYNYGTGNVHLPNGTRAEYVKWKTGYPNRNRQSTGICFEATGSRKSNLNQDMWNIPPTYDSIFGVICEK